MAGNAGLPFAAGANVEQLALRDGALPCEVAGDTDRSMYDRSGLLLLLKVETSDGSLKRSFSDVTLAKGRSCAR